MTMHQDTTADTDEQVARLLALSVDAAGHTAAVRVPDDLAHLVGDGATMRQDLVRRMAVVEERLDATRRGEHTAITARLWESDPVGATAVLLWCYLRRQKAVDAPLRQAARWIGQEAPVSTAVASSWAHARAAAAALAGNSLDAAPEAIREAVDGAAAWLGLVGDRTARA